MNFPKELTTVTPLSKGLALSMFVFIPFVTFIVGINIGEGVIMNQLSGDSSSIKVQPARLPLPTIVMSAQKDLYISTVMTQKNEKKIVSITSNEKGDTLSIRDKDSTTAPKIIYTLPFPRETGFDEMVFFDKDYGVVNHDTSDILIFNLDGRLIASSVHAINPQFSSWMIKYNGDVVSSTIIKIGLSDIAGGSGSAEIDLTTGKLIPGTLIAHKTPTSLPLH